MVSKRSTKTQKPCLKINECFSNDFALALGTRQGCPLSRLLFALAVEPLAEALRIHPNIHRKKSGPMEFKLVLYLNWLDYLTHPLDSLGALQDLSPKISAIIWTANKLHKVRNLSNTITAQTQEDLKHHIGGRQISGDM